MNNQSQTSTHETPPAIGIADILRLVRRRLLLIASITVALTVLAALALSQVAPRYSAKAVLIIGNRGAEPVNVEAVIAGLATDPETVMSEIEVLKSRRLANLVIDQLMLDQTPEFNHSLRPAGFVDRFFGAKASNTNVAVPTEADGELLQGLRVRVIYNVLDRLKVSPVPNSRAVSVSFSSENPVTAAEVANALADLYLVDQLESKYESVQRAADWLNARVASLRDKVQESERRVEEFREQSGLLEGGGTTLTDQEISLINPQVVAVSNQRAEAEANLRQVRRLLKSGDGVDTAGVVLNSPLIQRLREQESAIARRLAELSSEFGDRHPTMVKLRAEGADLAASIEAEIAKIVVGLENRVRIARSNEANLIRNLTGAKERIGADNKALVTLRSLEREAEANRLVLESMLTRFAQTSEQDDLASQRPDARIISRAVVPFAPNYPMKKAILALVFLSAGFFGLMLAFAREFMEEGFRSGKQLEEAAGVASLGFVPRLRRRDLIGHTPLSYFMDNPSTPFSESFRTLYSLLTAVPQSRPPKTLLVASSLASEGKTTVALCLAGLVAQSGKRAIVVDGDCRRPAVLDAMGMAGGYGLMEYLSGRTTLDGVIQTHKESRIHLIGAGAATANPPTTLSSPKFEQLMQTLSANYDFVIVDSPPVMAVSDALMLTGKVDATLLVTRWGRTRRSAVGLTVKHLRTAGGHVAGALLTQVDARKYAQYGYGDSGSYVGELAAYQKT